MNNEIPVMRVARPTDNLAAIKKMYVDGLGMNVLGEFAGHDGFDGVMLGQKDAPYHIEFTSRAGHSAGKAPTEDNLLVFYFPDRPEWQARCQQMIAAGFRAVTSFNPYWDRSGKSFEDVDGYRVVIQNAASPV